MKITQFYISTSPAEWRLLPWISTLKPTDAGRLFYKGGWQFTWLFIRLQRHHLKTV